MKKNRILKLGLLVLALTLVTASLVSGTFAKYVTTVTGTGTVTVATWSAKVGPDGTLGTTAFTLDSTIDANDDVVATEIAPGTKGSFSLAFNTTGTEVDHNVSITLKGDASLSGLTYLTFSLAGDDDITTMTLAQLVAGYKIFDEDYLAGTGTGSGAKTVTVNWEWPFESDAAQDTADTTDGETPIQAAEITAEFVATQLNPDGI